jgi:Protein of unknown function (DUF2786)
MPNERILDKIRKCLALSTSSNPHEAQSAMRQAQKLMEMHGMTTKDAQVSTVDELRAKSLTSISRPKAWETKLSHLVAGAFGGHIMWHSMHSSCGHKEYFGSYVFIGMKDKIEVMHYTFQVLQRNLFKQRQAYISTNKQEGQDRQSMSAIGDTFAMGWLEAVAKTVATFVLGVQERATVTAYIEAKYPRRTKSAGKKQYYGGAQHAEAGRQAGAGQALHHPMTQRKNLLLG